MPKKKTRDYTEGNIVNLGRHGRAPLPESKRRYQQSISQYRRVWECIDDVVDGGEFSSRSEYIESLVVPDLESRGYSLRGVPSDWRLK